MAYDAAKWLRPSKCIVTQPLSRHSEAMGTFEELVTDAEEADVTGWGFQYLDGRATEERPPWAFSRLLAEHLSTVDSALDLDTGGGEVINEAPALPATMAVTEAWPPNVARARQTLGARGVHVVQTDADADQLPFDDESFDLVTARHPVRPNYWTEIWRVLRPEGHYLAQHVGPSSAIELIEYFLGPRLPEQRSGREPILEADGARAAGLSIERLETARCRMEFYDIGAVVWILRKCVWWVPDFSVARYEGRLRDLDSQLRAGQPFVAHSTRHLIVATRQ